MYYRWFANTPHPVQTIHEESSAFPSWALSEGKTVSAPIQKSKYVLEKIDNPLSTGYGNFALFYENRKLIREDFHAVLVELGVRNIQVFNVELIDLEIVHPTPTYFNYNVVGVIDFNTLRSLSNSISNMSFVKPNANNMLLLDSSDGTGNIIVHQKLKDELELRYSNQLYFEALSV